MSAKSRDGMPTLPRIGGSSNAQTSNENAQDEAAAEIREQRERVKNSKNKSRGRRRQKPDMYANNPLGASIRRKGKFKGAVYKRRKPKPATKPGKGLTDKRGQFRMFRQRKRTLADLHQAKANVLATIRTMGALAAAGKAGKVRREDAERALKRVMRSVANTGDAEALRQGVKQAQEAGLTPQNGILRKAQRELESLILQQLLRRKMEECDLSRNSADLRKVPSVKRIQHACWKCSCTPVVVGMTMCVKPTWMLLPVRIVVVGYGGGCQRRSEQRNSCVHRSDEASQRAR